MMCQLLGYRWQYFQIKADDAKAEGRRICVELIQQLRELVGVSGAHLMAPHGEQAAAQVITDCGVLENRAA